METPHQQAPGHSSSTTASTTALTTPTDTRTSTTATRRTLRAAASPRPPPPPPHSGVGMTACVLPKCSLNRGTFHEQCTADDSRLQRRLRRVHTQRFADSTPHHGFETLLSPQPWDSSPDGQSDGRADHPCPLPDYSSPHGHVFFPYVRTPVLIHFVYYFIPRITVISTWWRDWQSLWTWQTKKADKIYSSSGRQRNIPSLLLCKKVNMHVTPVLHIFT